MEVLGTIIGFVIYAFAIFCISGFMACKITPWLSEESEEDHDKTNKRTLVIFVILMILGIPFLL